MSVTELPVRHVMADQTVSLLEALLAQQTSETGPLSAKGLIILLPSENGILDLIKPLAMSDEQARAILKAALESLEQ